MPRTRLQAILELGLSDRRDETALRTQGRGFSYSELELRVGRAAAGLVHLGVAPGDRVALFLPNGHEAVIATLACYRAGAVAVPLNYRYHAHEAGDVLERVAARVLLYHASRSDVVEGIEHRPAAEHLFVAEPGSAPSRGADFEALLADEPLERDVPVGEESPALILFTSGSTGSPKGVVHTHASAFAGIRISRQITCLSERDVVLVGKPISHAGGLETQLMPTLLAGGCAVLEMKPPPEQAVERIRQYGASQYALMASDLIDFIEYLEAHPTQLPTLTNMLASGDSVPHDLHHRFRDLFGWEVMEGCGMTEIGSYYAMNPRHGVRKWGSLGLPCPDTELRIVGAGGAEQPPGETGEIVVRTPAAAPGYWKDPEQTAELYRGGWLHTGDLGRVDEDGYVWFVSRKKLLIVRRGPNMAPAEIEDVLDTHPKVHASVAVGVADPREGQVPVALIAPRSPANPPSEAELREFVSSRLAAYKNPAHYLFLDALPRMGNGKFDRAGMRAQAERAFAGGA